MSNAKAILKMFHFVSGQPEVLTPELEASISNASAWAHVVPTGSEKPIGSMVGALVTESFLHLKSDVESLKHKTTSLEKDNSEIKRKLIAETKVREEYDMVLAQQLAAIQNLKQDKDRIHDANSVLYNCIICMDRQRTMRLEPCGHMATCAPCTEEVINRQGSTCPLCRIVVSGAQRTYLS